MKPMSLWAALLVVALTLGCVTRGRYVDTVAERDRLEQQNERLLQRIEVVQGRQSAMVDVALGLETDLALAEGELAMLQREQGELAEEFSPMLGSGRIELQLREDGLHLVLAGELVFEPGSAELHDAGRALLGRIVGELEEVPYQIAVLGHTDAKPLRSGARYASNWELAAARAANVVHVLESGGIPPERLLVVSFGSTRPVAPDDTPENRARNRRVDLRLRPARR